MPTPVVVSEVSKSFTMHLRDGIQLPVVSDVTFSVKAGECVVLGGPSGIGKSSLLKMVYGNYGVDEGQILVEHPVGQALLDDEAVLHHHHAVRQKPGNREVVRDDDRRKAEVLHEATQQVEQTCLHRDVEAAGRLVHEDEARGRHQIARDLQALAHAAGKGARLVVDAVETDLDPAEPVARRLADPAIVPVTDRHQALADIGAGRDRHA